MSILDTLSALMTLLVLAVAISYYVSHFILTAVLSVQLMIPLCKAGENEAILMGTLSCEFRLQYLAGGILV